MKLGQQNIEHVSLSYPVKSVCFPLNTLRGKHKDLLQKFLSNEIYTSLYVMPCCYCNSKCVKYMVESCVTKSERERERERYK